jgi:hypothetical protein
VFTDAWEDGGNKIVVTDGAPPQHDEFGIDLGEQPSDTYVPTGDLCGPDCTGFVLVPVTLRGEAFEQAPLVS